MSYFKGLGEHQIDKVITYTKIDSTYAKIVYNGVQIGHIENHFSHLTVNVYGKRYSFLKKNKNNIAKFIRDYAAFHQLEQYSYQRLEMRGFKIKG